MVKLKYSATIRGINGIGKSTYIKILAGVETPTTDGIDLKLKVSHKPQYLKADSDVTMQMLLRQATHDFDTSYYQSEILLPLGLEPLLDQNRNYISAG